MPQRRATIREIIISWLNSNIGETISVQHFDGVLPGYGRLRFGVLHNGGSYERTFRRMRMDNKITVIGNMRIIELETDKNHKAWRIE